MDVFDDMTIEQLRHVAREMSRSLTNLQTVSTSQCNQLRGLRAALFGTDPSECIKSPAADRATAMRNVLGEVVGEMWSASCKHGTVEEQNLPLGIGTPDAVAYEVLAKDRYERAKANGTLTWVHALDEESAEAMGAKTPAEARAECIQTASTALRMVQAIDLGAT